MRQTTHIRFGGHAPRQDRDVTASVAGFSLLARLHDDLADASDAEVTIDFSGVAWFDTHLTAPLEVVLRIAARRGNAVRLTGLRPRLREAFARNRLIDGDGPDRPHAVIPIASFDRDGSPGLSAFVQRQLERPEMPRLTPDRRELLLACIDELFANVAPTVGSSAPIVAGGQFFPRSGRLAFSLAAAGPSPDDARSGPRAVDTLARALEPRSAADEARLGGPRSAALHAFFEETGGRLTVVSGDRFWSRWGQRIMTRTLVRPYPGTVAVLDLNTPDGRTPEAR